MLWLLYDHNAHQPRGPRGLWHVTASGEEDLVLAGGQRSRDNPVIVPTSRVRIAVFRASTTLANNVVISASEVTVASVAAVRLLPLFHGCRSGVASHGGAVDLLN
jgi:hypothetical protein